MSSADNTILLEKTYTLQGGDFMRAGEVSSSIKKTLKEIGIDSQIIRRMAIASFEAEINVVCYAERGTFNLTITPDMLKVVVQDVGRGIADIELAMKEGYSTATERFARWDLAPGWGFRT